MIQTLEDLVLVDKKFLHELSNQLLIAQGMTQIGKKLLEEQDSPVVDQQVLDKLAKALMALGKLEDLLKNQKNVLLEVNDQLKN